jgi:hypothetical protein
VDRPRGRRRRRVSGTVLARRSIGAGWLPKAGTAETWEGAGAGAEHGWIVLERSRFTDGRTKKGRLLLEP